MHKRIFCCGRRSGARGMEAASSFVSRKQKKKNDDDDDIAVGSRRSRRSRRSVLPFFWLLLFCCCCGCWTAALGLVASSSSSSSDRKSETEKKAQEQQGQEQEQRVAGGGGDHRSHHGVGQEQGLSLEFGVLARVSDGEMHAKVEPFAEGEEAEMAGDGREVSEKHRIVLFRRLAEEASASPSPSNDAGQQEGSNDKPPQDDQNANQTTEASKDAGTPPDPGTNDTGTVKEDQAPMQERDCHSEPLFADLKAGDGNSDWTLTVNNTGKDELKVSVIAESLKARPAEFSLKTGEGNMVAITILDKGKGSGDKINITWGAEYCQITVPAQGLPPSQLPDPANLNIFPLTRTGFMLFGGTILFVAILGIAGVWGCVSWHARAQWPGGGTAKYQELEMGLQTVDSLKKDTEEGLISAEGWDEIWEDDEWEDTEAVRSSNLQTLSSQGLNVRRANKDEWDSAWDD